MAVWVHTCTHLAACALHTHMHILHKAHTHVHPCILADDGKKKAHWEAAYSFQAQQRCVLHWLLVLSLWPRNWKKQSKEGVLLIWVVQPVTVGKAERQRVAGWLWELVLWLPYIALNHQARNKTSWKGCWLSLKTLFHPSDPQPSAQLRIPKTSQPLRTVSSVIRQQHVRVCRTFYTQTSTMVYNAGPRTQERVCVCVHTCVCCAYVCMFMHAYVLGPQWDLSYSSSHMFLLSFKDVMEMTTSSGIVTGMKCHIIWEQLLPSDQTPLLHVILNTGAFVFYEARKQAAIGWTWWKFTHGSLIPAIWNVNSRPCWACQFIHHQGQHKETRANFLDKASSFKHLVLSS